MGEFTEKMPGTKPWALELVKERDRLYARMSELDKLLDDMPLMGRLGERRHQLLQLQQITLNAYLQAVAMSITDAMDGDDLDWEDADPDKEYWEEAERARDENWK